MNVTVQVNSSREFFLPYADDGRVCTMIFRYRQASDVSNLLTLIGLAAVAP